MRAAGPGLRRRRRGALLAAGPGARLWRLVFVLWGQGPPVGKAPPPESWQIEKSDVEKVGMFPAVLTYCF